MLADKLLLLNWKRVLLILGAFVLAVILHNAVYALFKGYFDAHGGDEGFFMMIAFFVIPPYALISLVYTVVRLLTRKR
jgi:hypothetical protein